MLAVEKKKKYTADDYRLLEEGAPFQLINNELIMSPSPLMIHQLILGEFYDELKSFVKNYDKTNPGMVAFYRQWILFWMISGNILSTGFSLYIQRKNC